jgi:hypothetical protein
MAVRLRGGSEGVRGGNWSGGNWLPGNCSFLRSWRGRMGNHMLSLLSLLLLLHVTQSIVRYYSLYGVVLVFSDLRVQA